MDAMIVEVTEIYTYLLSGLDAVSNFVCISSLILLAWRDVWQ